MLYYVIDTRDKEKILGFNDRLSALNKVQEWNKIYLRDEGIRPFDILTIATKATETC